MRTIYQPKGKAAEYAPLALNIYTHCNHGCKFPCYMTTFPWYKPNTDVPTMRLGLPDALEKQCKKMAGDPREIMLCFGCDPYPRYDNAATREVLLMLEKHRMTATVLTKGGTRAVRDFDILKRNNWKFGQTIVFLHDSDRAIWEPGAATIADRIDALERAHKMGIYTWVSLEPVVDPEQAIGLIDLLGKYVDFWKIG